MTAPIDDERVRLALDEHVEGRTVAPSTPVSGRAPAPRRTAPHPPGGRQSTRGAGRGGRVDLVVFFTLQPLHHHGRSGIPAATPSVPSGWVAHSAYGLQIAAPRTWSVQVFGQCPDGSRPGTLFIGTSQFDAFCPEYGADATRVDMYRTDDGPTATDQDHGPAHVSGCTGCR